MAIKYVTAVDSQGFLLVRLEPSQERVSVPYGLKVDVLSVQGGRENFKILEGFRRNKMASVRLQGNGQSQFGNVTHTAAASAVFTIRAGKVRFGNGLELAATTMASNPPPTGTHNLEIADEAHPGGEGYLSRSVYAKTWFRVGNSGDRYLHPGRISAGCVTVTEVEKWGQVWQYLILARKGDGLNAGTIRVA